MWERYLAVFLVFGVGSFELFHAIFDGLNFGSNAEMVRQVISMEQSREPDAWRAIGSPAVATAAYGLIWLTHALSGCLALVGCWLLFSSDPGTRQKGLTLSFCGVGAAAVLYFVGFGAIAGSWFLMYTAPTPPNFGAAARQIFIADMAVILYLTQLRGRPSF